MFINLLSVYWLSISSHGVDDHNLFDQLMTCLDVTGLGGPLWTKNICCKSMSIIIINILYNGIINYKCT